MTPNSQRQVKDLALFVDQERPVLCSPLTYQTNDHFSNDRSINQENNTNVEKITKVGEDETQNEKVIRHQFFDGLSHSSSPTQLLSFQTLIDQPYNDSIQYLDDVSSSDDDLKINFDSFDTFDSTSLLHNMKATNTNEHKKSIENENQTTAVTKKLEHDISFQTTDRSWQTVLMEKDTKFNVTFRYRKEKNIHQVPSVVYASIKYRLCFSLSQFQKDSVAFVNVELLDKNTLQTIVEDAAGEPSLSSHHCVLLKEEDGVHRGHVDFKFSKRLSFFHVRKDYVLRVTLKAEKELIVLQSAPFRLFSRKKNARDYTKDKSAREKKANNLLAQPVKRSRDAYHSHLEDERLQQKKVSEFSKLFSTFLRKLEQLDRLSHRLPSHEQDIALEMLKKRFASTSSM